MKRNFILMMIVVIIPLLTMHSQGQSKLHKVTIYESPFYKRLNAIKDRLIKYEFFVNDSVFYSDSFKTNKEKYVKDTEKAHLKTLKTYDRFVFKKDSLFGIKNISGEIISPPKFSKFNKTEQGIFYAFNESKGCWILFNKELVQITECKYADVFCPDFDSNKCFVQKANLFGTIDTTGREMIPPLYSELKYVGDNFLLAINDERKDLITYDNKIIFSGKDKIIKEESCFDKSRGFESYCKFKKNGKIGVFDNTGKVIFPAKYDKIKIADFKGEKNNLTAFILNIDNKWSVSYNGKTLIEGLELIHPLIEMNYTDFRFEFDFLIYKKQNSYGIISNINNKLI
ncbi:MAG TPA: hypothetical protein ENK91_10380, partial [Bacteroidetes bacterium]|nr:hypothetical protein [Bacteroidota bacterium]